MRGRPHLAISRPFALRPFWDIGFRRLLLERHRMIISTTFDITGRSITQHLGLVRGNVVRSRFIGRDIVAGLRMIVGGEIHEYTKLLAESREQALDRMIQHAQSLGADAVVGVRFETTDAGQGQATEVLAYGTAVKL
jgi:uncharacterized protein YbjQ (UPF0145 family)